MPTSKRRAGGGGARRSRSEASTVSLPGPATERELDGSVTEYFDVDVRGDRVERLLTELFT